MFTTGWGEPIYPDTVTSLMTKLIGAHNEPDDDDPRPKHQLPHARLHDLRHLHATTLQMSGVASSASFASFGERALPGPQRVALRRSQREERGSVPVTWDVNSKLHQVHGCAI